jgi:hypothetical protein
MPNRHQFGQFRHISSRSIQLALRHQGMHVWRYMNRICARVNPLRMHGLLAAVRLRESTYPIPIFETIYPSHLMVFAENTFRDIRCAFFDLEESTIQGLDSPSHA